jgi:hypothetical protein
LALRGVGANRTGLRSSAEICEEIRR